ncbi:tyrosine-type recombinase/integrase [Oceanobacillus kimchii]|uniref:Integrase n=1 Tax=Oceanobacillus kimchii TaxID=746691 RepID=A0ABQ5TH06_9BACI|nr:site-specific integrase [Oceanobacillus kimchii]GLO66156.1 hypothetical protein MACH08_19400 [Oceanobacillus kimchii]
MESLTKFNNIESAYDHIQMWLDGQESENTRINYERSVNKLINYKFKASLEHVQIEQINSLTYVDMKRFRDNLRRTHGASTVNGYMMALYSMFKELSKIQDSQGKYIYTINVDQLRTKTLKVTDVNSAGDISWKEVDQWIEYLKESNVANKERRIAFLELARVTGLRKDALAELSYKDLVRRGDVWQLKSTLKSTTKHVSISNEVAELLESLHKNPKDKQEKILKLSTKSMDRLFSEVLRPEFNIDPERNVTVHSLRGLSIWEAYLASGKDILAAKEHAGHSSIETTYNYIKSRSQTFEQPSLYMGKGMDSKQLTTVNMNDMKKIFDDLSRSAQYEIINKAKNMGLIKKNI